MNGNVPPGRWKLLHHPVVDERAVLKAAAKLNTPNANAQIAWAKEHHAKLLAAGAQFWRSADYLVVMVDGAIALPMDWRARSPAVWWLRIYRHDGKRIHNHWNELQRIKNELVGPEHQGVEFYPPESMLQDGENSFHLWVFKSVDMRLPFGLPWKRSWGADTQSSIPTRFIVEGP